METGPPLAAHSSGGLFDDPDPDLLLRQPIQFVHQYVYLRIRGVDLALIMSLIWRNRFRHLKLTTFKT